VLRELADEIAKEEGSEVLPQEVISYTEAPRDDYVMTTLVIRYHQKQAVPEVAELRGPDSLMPIDVQARA